MVAACVRIVSYRIVCLVGAPGSEERQRAVDLIEAP